jgi:general secretion pathway protein A
MYQNFFGFKERPFQLVPNPAYLFLSPSHEEALAHLTYATSQGDGFVVVTGEVGTGKTTLCRAFIESLDDQTEVAYIFNPKLTAIELLQTICDEFGIQTSADTTKAIIDAFNAFLMEKKSQGLQVLLIIDEAQNLNHDVLEQVRLLSNIETNTEKLLQIILVGQPEMADLLDSYELRQL